MLGVQPGHRGTELLAERAGQRCRRGLDDRHVQAQFRCGRGDFGADEPGADHRQPRTRPQLLAQGQRVIDGAQHVHPGQALRARPRPRPSAGGDDHAVGTDRGPVVEATSPVAASSLLGAHPEQPGRVQVLVVGSPA